MSVSSIFSSDNKDSVVSDITNSISGARKAAQDYDQAFENMKSKQKAYEHAYAEYRNSVDNLKHLQNLKNIASENANKKCADNLPGLGDYIHSNHHHNNGSSSSSGGGQHFYSFSNQAGAMSYYEPATTNAASDNSSMSPWDNRQLQRAPNYHNYYSSSS